MKTVDDLLSSSGLANGIIGQLNSHHDKSNVLRSVGLGGGDTDLGTSVDVDTTVGFTRERRLESARLR